MGTPTVIFIFQEHSENSHVWKKRPFMQEVLCLKNSKLSLQAPVGLITEIIPTEAQESSQVSIVTWITTPSPKTRAQKEETVERKLLFRRPRRATHIWDPTGSGYVKAWIIDQLRHIVSDTFGLGRALIFCFNFTYKGIKLLLMLIKNTTGKIHSI